MRKHVTRIAILLLLGAIVNIAVAWWLHETNGLGKGRIVTYWHGEPNAFVSAGYRKCLGYIRFAYNVIPKSDLSAPMSRIISGREEIVWTLEEAIPRGNRSSDGKPLRDYYCKAGLPLYTIDASNRSEFVDLTAAMDTALYVLVRDISQGSTRFPTRIIWSGLIINMVFYAGLLWTIFFGPFAARRWIRRRRGLCERCAYPTGTSPVCTECGVTLEIKPQAVIDSPSAD